jgi:hypothetical protein
MGGELNVIVSIFNAIYFVLTSPWEALEPFVTRILHIVILVFACVWTWKKIKKL